MSSENSIFIALPCYSKSTPLYIYTTRYSSEKYVTLIKKGRGLLKSILDIDFFGKPINICIAIITQELLIKKVFMSYIFKTYSF